MLDLSKQQEELDDFFSDYDDESCSKNLRILVDNLPSGYAYNGLETLVIKPVELKQEPAREITLKSKKAGPKNNLF